MKDHMIAIMWAGVSIFNNADERKFETNELVFRAGNKVTSIFLVLSGTVVLIRSLPSGDQIVLQRAISGDVVAEASAYSECYHCDCEAVEPTKLACLPLKTFRDKLRFDNELSESWSAHLAHTVQTARMRSEIRSLKTVAMRLDAWISEYGSIPGKGHWQSLADELSISREALYRELARRRQSGI